MSPHKDYFVKYHPYSGGMAYISVTWSPFINCRGAIRIMLDDDKKRKLCDVWHVLDLQKDFLPIKMTYKIGYSTRFGDNCCKITKVSPKVEYGESHQKLYQFSSDTMIYHVGITNSMNTLDAMMLCNQCFGHISEKCLRISMIELCLIGLSFIT